MSKKPQKAASSIRRISKLSRAFQAISTSCSPAASLPLPFVVAGGGAAAAFVSSFMKLSNSLSRSSAVRLWSESVARANEALTIDQQQYEHDGNVSEDEE